MRRAEIVRKTNETDIRLCIDLDGSGKNSIKTGCGFMDHMLELFSRHARFDLEIEATGDTYVDYHHTAEDVGIALGLALKQALGDCRGINRYGYFLLPMDEALTLVSLDISGRAHLSCSLNVKDKVGDFDTELVPEFFAAVCRNAGLTLHIKQLDGLNTHHIIEAVFKGFGRALSSAVAVSEAWKGEVPSTKGVL
jgi:imidazoleglycerol-phosphate dehydratase